MSVAKQKSISRPVWLRNALKRFGIREYSEAELDPEVAHARIERACDQCTAAKDAAGIRAWRIAHNLDKP